MESKKTEAEAVGAAQHPAVKDLNVEYRQDLKFADGDEGVRYIIAGEITKAVTIDLDPKEFDSQSISIKFPAYLGFPDIVIRVL